MVTASKILVSTLASAVLAAVPAASASSVKSCPGVLAAGDSHFTTDPVEGTVSAANVTTRDVSCPAAKSFIVALPPSKYSHARFRFRRFSCRITATGEESSETRCVRGSKVIRWESGA